MIRSVEWKCGKCNARGKVEYEPSRKDSEQISERRYGVAYDAAIHMLRMHIELFHTEFANPEIIERTLKQLQNPPSDEVPV